MDSQNKPIEAGTKAKASSLVELNTIYEAEKKSKKELADKVMIVKGLTKTEKIAIYKAITGEEPPKIKRGARPKRDRDMKFAQEYFRTEAIDKLNAKDRTGLTELAEKHLGHNFEQTAIEKAFKRGVKALEIQAEEMVAMIKENVIAWDAMITELSKDTESAKHLDLIEKSRLDLIQRLSPSAVSVKELFNFVKLFERTEKIDKRKLKKEFQPTKKN